MRRLRSFLAAPAAAGLFLSVAAACGNAGSDRDPTAFCERVGLAQSALTDPSDPAALVALYQDLDDETPLQIKDDWHQITELLGEVTSYDPNDPTAVQEVLKSVLRSQVAVTAVAVWTRDNCRIELGPIPTAVPIGGTGDGLLSDDTSDTVADDSTSS